VAPALRDSGKIIVYDGAGWRLQFSWTLGEQATAGS
jgi:hypothetical protein